MPPLLACVNPTPLLFKKKFVYWKANSKLEKSFPLVFRDHRFLFIQSKSLSSKEIYYNHKLLLLGFNRCPYQLLRPYKRHKENKSKTGQERSSMQQADYQCHRPTPWMQESVSMHKSPTPVRYSRINQSRWEEGENERKRDRKDRGQEADGREGWWKEMHCSG